MKGFADAFVEGVILKVINRQLPSREAARILRITKRHADVLGRKRALRGIRYLKHADSGSESPLKTDPAAESSIISLYSDKYDGFNYTHSLGKLKNDEGISISYKAPHGIPADAGFTSPKARRGRRKPDVHPSRPRRESFGELIQTDAPIHQWFKGHGFKVALHGAIDDAAGTAVGLCSDHEETPDGYYHTPEKTIARYGVPRSFYTDKRTILAYGRLKDKGKRTENSANVRFGRCRSRLGIDIMAASIPQAKGKIERPWGTLQSRPLSELALRKIASIGEANEFLPGFEKEFNEEFALPVDGRRNVFKAWNKTIGELHYYLSTQYAGITDSGCSFSLENTKYQVIDGQSKVPRMPNKTKSSVYRTMGGDIVVVYQGKFYETKVCKSPKMKTVEFAKTAKPHWKPSPDHPWRKFVVACG